MEKTKKLDNDFTSGSIPKKLIKFMGPILVALILQAMYGAVDLMVVGKFGTSADISGVATGTNIINFFTFTVTGLTMGVTVLISRYLGERRGEKVGKVIGGAICFFAVLAVVLSVLILIFADGISTIMQAPKDAHALTSLYVRICGGGMIFIIAYNVISGIFRGMGDSKNPLLFVLIACVVNIIGDLILVGGCGLGVAGAAIATVSAQAVSVVLSLLIIRKKQLAFTMTKSDIRFSGEIKKFLKIGFPIGLQEFLTQISFLVLCAVINNISLEASSGYGVAQKVVSFIMLIPAALMQSMSAFVGQNVGAGNDKRAKSALFTGMGMGAAVGLFIMIFIYFWGNLPASLFSDDTLVIERAFEYLKGFSSEAVITCILFSLMGYFNGYGRTMFVMAQGLLQSFLIRMPLSYIMSLKEGATLTEIGIAVPIATVFGIILCVIYYFRMQKQLKRSIKVSPLA